MDRGRIQLWDNILKYYEDELRIRSYGIDRVLDVFNRVRRKEKERSGVAPATIEHPYHILRTLIIYEYIKGEVKRAPSAERLREIREQWKFYMPEPSDFLEFQTYLVSLFLYAAILERPYPEIEPEKKKYSLNERVVSTTIDILVNSWETAGLLGYSIDRSVLGDLIIESIISGWTHYSLEKHLRGAFYRWLNSLHDLAAGMSLIASSSASWSRYLQILSPTTFTPKKKPGKPFQISPTLLGFWAWRNIEAKRQKEVKFEEILNLALAEMLPYLQTLSEVVNEWFAKAEESTPFTNLVDKLRSKEGARRLGEQTLFPKLFMTSDLLNSIFNEAAIEGYMIHIPTLLKNGVLELKRVR